MRDTLDRRGMLQMTLGHCASDIAQSAPPALLVFLKPKLDLSYTAAAGIMLALTISSSVVQPLFGRWSDRRGALWIMPVGLVVGGLGIGLAALAEHYALAVLLVFVGGLGIGAYHPESARIAGESCGRRRASDMMIYMVGGSIGHALGPLLISSAVIAYGINASLLVAAPSLLIAAAILLDRRHLASLVSATSADVSRAPAPPILRRPLALLTSVVLLRSVAFYGIITFVPLWEVAEGNGKGHGARMLTYILLAGAVGTIVSGPLADRLGRKTVLLASLVVSVPLMLVYVYLGGMGGQTAMVLAGVPVAGTFGITLLMTQEYMPGRAATAAGLSVGAAIGVGGVMAIVLGGIADAIDLRTALVVSAAMPGLAAILALWLPRGPHPSRPPRPAESAAASASAPASA